MKIDPGAHIGTVALKVSDLVRSEEFYTDVLGMQVLERSNGRVSLGAPGRPLLRLVEVAGARPKPRRSTGLYHFALLTPSREALGRSLRRLIEKGYPLQGAADHLVSEALYLSDPDGNGIEIYRDRPKEDWTFDGSQVRMANEPVDLESLIADAGGERWVGLDPSATMGHIHLHVRDLEEAEAFYSGELGLDVMLRWPPSALFVAAGGYHHHVGLNTWTGVGAPPPPEDAVGLISFEIVVPSGAGAMAEKMGVGAKDGRFLLADPSGNKIELIQG